MTNVVSLTPPLSLAAKVSRAWCYASDCCIGLRCMSAADCPFSGTDPDVTAVLACLASVLAADEALAREIGRDAVSAVVRRLRSE